MIGSIFIGLERSMMDFFVKTQGFYFKKIQMGVGVLGLGTHGAW
jgi:hypothetical protein